MVQRRRPSGFIEPCKPSRVVRPPSGPLWVHEIKHDGYRLMVRRDGERVRCFLVDHYAIAPPRRHASPLQSRFIRQRSTTRCPSALKRHSLGSFASIEQRSQAEG